MGQVEGDQASIPPGIMHFHMMLQGVVTLDPGGKTARGRWYLVMIGVNFTKDKSSKKSDVGHGVYENEFVKENGVWKFKKMLMSIHFLSPLDEGWMGEVKLGGMSVPEPDAPPTEYHPYPNLQMLPYHFKHPVTGK
jgi:hypothetical protein